MSVCVYIGLCMYVCPLVNHCVHTVRTYAYLVCVYNHRGDKMVYSFR